MPPEISFARYFAELPDPRVTRTRKHRLDDILGIALCAVICGADSFDRSFPDDGVLGDPDQFRFALDPSQAHSPTDTVIGRRSATRNRSEYVPNPAPSPVPLPKTTVETYRHHRRCRPNPVPALHPESPGVIPSRTPAATARSGSGSPRTTSATPPPRPTGRSRTSRASPPWPRS